MTAEAPAGTGSAVAERLARFLCDAADHGVPPEVRHEATRLMLNQLKASVAAGSHPLITILHDWARSRHGRGAHVHWFGAETSVEDAAFVNGALYEVLDFHDTYIPTYLHAVSGVLPAALAVAEADGQSGDRFVTALALGIEAELAIATILMPTGYFRGFVPLGLVGATGAAAACAVLARLDVEHTTHALSLAMASAGGPYESVGSMALPYITGITARAGVTAASLAALGVDAPVTMFEGEMGMLKAYSDEPAAKIDEVLATLGVEWRIHGQSYKTMPTETITHAPVELALALRGRAGDRELASMRFGVSPIVVKIADERRDRFGAPSSELEARFDLRHCAAAAWVRGRFGLDEMREAAYIDPSVLALRSRIELVADETRATFDGAWLEVGYTDGSTDALNIDAFKGTPANPLTDDELGVLFRSSAVGLLPADRADAIVAAAFSLELAADVRSFVGLLRTV